ncbi:nitroreductase family protein [Chryseobacterium sp. GCR10]|uniref:Nitroreductase family protein n=2 Tax=Chryseobacterium caseinilyticum TaxID=2771428 RepID=A0ABR8ZFP9_9FLAO|nr:nitroreductase family protein [Chryseobacterium caseinilyticum]
MSFLQKMKNRYTVKKYNAEGEIDAEQIEELKEILKLSPSSINSQPWNFVFVTSKEIKEQLSEVSFHNTAKVIESKLVIVFQVLKSVEDFETQIEENLPEMAVNYYKSMVQPHGEEYIKNWMAKQVYISLGVLLSACAEMGIDCTPMEGIKSAEYDEILQNRKYESLFAVAIGQKSEADKNQPIYTPKRRLETNKVVLER